jgi:hypothetical protein
VVNEGFHIGNNGIVSVTEFGAKVDGVTDDFIADSTACMYCILNPKSCSEVVFPVGHSRITRPLILQNNGKFFTIHIKGMYPAKSASDQYLSRIDCDFKSGPGIGIQLGRGIIIENLAIYGQYHFPYTITNLNIATTKFNDWNDGSVKDSRYVPYAGISIDPDKNSSGSRGGTSDATIQNCSIKQFMVGIALSPNGSTFNDEIINIDNDDIEACRVAIAICQDQSKTISITGFKCWSSCHTIVDGVTYGAGTGGGSVFCENWNIAGNVNQLFNVHTDRFPLSCKDIYCESLFRIGTVWGGAGSNFINCEMDFLTGAGMPAADYILFGHTNFYGGSYRYYDNSRTHRLNFSNFSGMFRDLILNNQPITIGLYGNVKTYPTPSFDNVWGYYSGKAVTNNADTLISIKPAAITIDRNKWMATITGVPNAVIGDYILGSPTSTTRKYHDLVLNPNSCNTLQIGRVISVSGNTLTLDDVGLNVFQTSEYDAVYIDRLK